MTDELILTCLLWARPGLEQALTDYEDAVISLLIEHDGTVLHRVIGSGVDGTPHEVQTYRFASQAALDDFIGDPRRLSLSTERYRVVARTELFPVRLA